MCRSVPEATAGGAAASLAGLEGQLEGIRDSLSKVSIKVTGCATPLDLYDSANDHEPRPSALDSAAWVTGRDPSDEAWSKLLQSLHGLEQQTKRLTIVTTLARGSRQVLYQQGGEASFAAGWRAWRTCARSISQTTRLLTRVRWPDSRNSQASI